MRVGRIEGGEEEKEGRKGREGRKDGRMDRWKGEKEEGNE